MTHNMKNIAYWLLEHSGIFRVLHRRGRRCLTVLFFHRALPSTKSRDFQCLQWAPVRGSAYGDQLVANIDYLSKYYTFVDLTTSYEFLCGHRSDLRNPLLICVDDGYRNAVTVAAKQLAPLGVRLTLFCTTGAKTPFWFDRLDYAVQAVASKGNFEFSFLDDNYYIAYQASQDRLSALCTKVIAASEGAPESARMAALESLIESLEKEADSRLSTLEDDLCSEVMTLEDIKRVATLADIGSHSVSHLRLAELDKSRAEAELADSHRALRAILGGKWFPTFAYPQGSYNEAVRKLVEKCGYKMAFTTEEGLNGPGCDLYALRRIHLVPTTNPRVIWSNLLGLNQTLAGKCFSR